MGRVVFVTATDTEVGKTYISADLLKLGNTTIGIKPVASGCELIQGKLYNEDALILQKAASHYLPYDVINPFAFLPPIAPNIAAQQKNISLSVKKLIEQTQEALSTPADLHIIEGFGGWHAPLNAQETMADYAVQINCEVILVVGIRLGCLNHAILTEKAIINSGANCIGWIANTIDPTMLYKHENIQTLKSWLKTPCLGEVEFGGSIQFLSNSKCF
jgi:dethiobiotin synthetase